ncbi:zinc-binding dehydrogenase [Ahrensia sp. 13_GOM-1096m]|uniref:zinc-binding dehydrogenase n=1 Tax=Ahrensia sp. 13_GOM-1096m TaxID=1380380 RepID=UPI000478DF1E|nr:zinc-binding dehydrogenase [Ahrensia sp. 13_GOM-1096m]
MNTMHAWVARSYGAPENVLKFEELPIPVPTGQQVLVKMIASSLNPIDLRMVQGYGSRLRKLVAKQEFPFVAGRDIVGEVVGLGPNATKFKIGDIVAGINDIKEIGGHAQYSAITETGLTKAPTNIPAHEVAAIPYVAMTTWSALVGKLKFDPEAAAGKHLFVHAGSGGVGSFTIQWAKSLGMKVSTTCGPSNIDWVKELGADVVVNYRDEDYRKIVSDVDFAYDTLGGDYEKATAALVKRGGGYVSIVHQLMPYTDNHGLILGALRVIGQIMRKKIGHGLAGRKYGWSIAQPNEVGIAHVMDKVAQGKIKPVIDKSLPISDIIAGYQHLETGRAKGKIILRWDTV